MLISLFLGGAPAERIDIKNGGKRMGVKMLNGKDEKGSTILVVILFLFLLTIFGISSLKTSIFESQIVRNHSIATQAFYSADSGISVASLRLKDIAIDSNPEWRTFIGDQEICETLGFNPENSNHSLLPRNQGSVLYDIAIKHRLDGEGNALLWGDSDGDYLNEINTSIGVPIEIVRSRGKYIGGIAIVEAVMRRSPLFFQPKAALFVGGSLQNNGVSGSAEGEYNSACDPVADIITTALADFAKRATDYTGDTGFDPLLISDGTPYPIALILEYLRENKKTQLIESGNNQVFGSESDTGGIYFCEGDFTGNNISGYGILAVDGDLVTSGNITWKGLVFIGGNSVYNGGGSKQVYGATLINGDVVINGTVDFKYDCQIVKGIFDLHSRYKVLTWNQL
jgi:hypothetical protein